MSSRPRNTKSARVITGSAAANIRGVSVAFALAALVICVSLTSTVGAATAGIDISHEKVFDKSMEASLTRGKASSRKLHSTAERCTEHTLNGEYTSCGSTQRAPAMSGRQLQKAKATYAKTRRLVISWNELDPIVFNFIEVPPKTSPVQQLYEGKSYTSISLPGVGQVGFNLDARGLLIPQANISVVGVATGVSQLQLGALPWVQVEKLSLNFNYDQSQKTTTIGFASPIKAYGESGTLLIEGKGSSNKLDIQPGFRANFLLNLARVDLQKVLRSLNIRSSLGLLRLVVENAAIKYSDGYSVVSTTTMTGSMDILGLRGEVDIDIDAAVRRLYFSKKFDGKTVLKLQNTVRVELKSVFEAASAFIKSEGLLADSELIGARDNVKSAERAVNRAKTATEYTDARAALKDAKRNLKDVEKRTGPIREAVNRANTQLSSAVKDAVDRFRLQFITLEAVLQDKISVEAVAQVEVGGRTLARPEQPFTIDVKAPLKSLTKSFVNQVVTETKRQYPDLARIL